MPATKAQVDRLAAGAQGGTSGVAAFDQAQTQLAQSRDTALAGIHRLANSVGAPAALTMQLSAQAAGPANTGLANLANLGASAAYANTTESQATSNYRDEANQAIPLIRAEADKELAQKLALLAAERSNASSSSDANALSDSELRNRLIGLAEQQRDAIARAQAPKLQQGVQQSAHDQQALALRQQNFSHITVAPQGFLPAFGRLQQMAEPQNDPMQQQAAKYGTQLTAAQASGQQMRQALANVMVRRYGPGITDEARKIALNLGISPDRAYGLLTPEVDAAYVSANRRLGLYHDPNDQSVTGQTLDALTAGQQLGFDPKTSQALATKDHWVWSDPNSAANSVFGAWLKQQFPDLDPSTITAEQMDGYRQQFMASPAGARGATNVVNDVLADAHTRVTQGYDYATWVRGLMAVPEYRYDPQSFQLAFAQAKPLFDYAAALHNRQTAIPDTGGASYDPTDPFATG